jgi:hypothetical protein
MEPRPFWEATSRSATQVFLNILWNPNVYYRAHKNPPTSLSWARLIKSIISYFISLIFILILSFHQRLGLPGGIYRSGFPTKSWPLTCISCKGLDCAQLYFHAFIRLYGLLPRHCFYIELFVHINLLLYIYKIWKRCVQNSRSMISYGKSFLFHRSFSDLDVSNF